MGCLHDPLRFPNIHLKQPHTWYIHTLVYIYYTVYRVQYGVNRLLLISSAQPLFNQPTDTTHAWMRRLFFLTHTFC